MEKQQSKDKNNALKNTMSRRSFLASVAASALEMATISAAKAHSPEASQPDTTREPYGERVKKFEITLDQAPTPEAYVDVFVSRLQAALTYDCTPKRAAQYIKNTSTYSGDILVDAMNEFDPAIIKGMFGLLDTVTPSDIITSPLYTIIRDAHHGVTMHYIDYLAQSGGESEAFTVTTLGSEITPPSDNTIFGVDIDLQIANNLEDDNPLKSTYDVLAEGVIRIGADPAVRGDGVYRASMSLRDRDLVPLRELASLKN